MNIVTASDAGFFHCLKELACSVSKFYNKPLIVYDIGLTDEQKQQIDAVIIPIKITEKVNHKGTILLAHQAFPALVPHINRSASDTISRTFSEPMILVDADCLFTTRVEEAGFDVGVTFYKSKKQIDYCNGVMNSGVIFFNSPAQKLVDAWAIECEKEKTTDQKAISDVLSRTINWKISNKVQDWYGLKVKIFNARIYNDYHLTKKGKILHFINTRHNKYIYEKLIEGYKQGKDIRKMFRWIKRGKKTRLERVFENITKFVKSK